MRNRRFVIWAGMMALFINCSMVGAECPPDAREVVRRFFQLDFEGYRLGSEGHQAIWQLTDQNGEPPAMPVVVTKSYEIVSAKMQNDKCLLRVRFNVYGHISEADSGLVFRQQSSSEEATVTVLCSDACRVCLDFKDFKLHPHPGKNATVKWLSDLESIRRTSAAKRRARALREKIMSLE